MCFQQVVDIWWKNLEWIKQVSAHAFHFSWMPIISEQIILLVTSERETGNKKDGLLFVYWYLTEAILLSRQ